MTARSQTVAGSFILLGSVMFSITSAVLGEILRVPPRLLPTLAALNRRGQSEGFAESAEENSNGPLHLWEPILSH